MKNVNLANVRSAIAITIAAVLLWPGLARADVDLVFVPGGTTVAELADRGLAPGLMSAGLGSVPPEQTYLDITQGNRVFDSLYDTELHPLGRDCEAWPAVDPTSRLRSRRHRPRASPVELRAAGRHPVGAAAPCTPSRPPADRAAALDRTSGRSRSATADRRWECVAGSCGGVGRRSARRRSADRDRAAAARGGAGAGDRDRRARVRRQPDLRQHAPRRLRALDRRRADDPRAARGRGPVGDVGSADPGRGRGRHGRDRVARRSHGGDPGPARAGDRLQPARLARRPRPGGRARRRARWPGPRCGWPGWRSSTCR